MLKKDGQAERREFDYADVPGFPVSMGKSLLMSVAGGCGE